MPSNFTQFPMPSIESVIDLFTYPTTLIGDAWAVLIMTIMWIILTTYINDSNKVNNINEAIVASSFATAVIAIIFTVSGLTTPYMVVFPIVLMGISGFILHLSKR